MKDLTHLEAADYLQIIWKRRWYFLIAFVLVSSGMLIYALQMPNIYKSETRVVVEGPMVSADYVRPTVRSTPEDRISSIREQVTSRTFLERMIEQLQMYGYGTDPKFVMENAVRAAQKQIGIEKTSNDTFTISFISTDPQYAQTVTRQIAQELIRISNSSQKDRVLATDQFIDEQLRQSTEALTAQGEKIKQFKAAHLGELPEQGTANMSAITGLHSQLNASENAIQQALERQKNLEFQMQEHRRTRLLEQSLAPADSAVRTTGPKGPTSLEVELAAKKNLLAQYAAKYTPNHPDVVTIRRDISRIEQQVQAQRAAAGTELTPIGEAASETGKKDKIADEVDPMESAFKFTADGIKNEIAKREKEKQEILQQIRVYQNRLKLAPSLEQELSTLLRDEGVLQARFDNLQKQKFSTQMATTVETDKKNETYRIIDEANLPVKPININRLQLILMGIGGGFLLGLGAAFGRELLDTTIGGEEEAKKLLNLPVLVTIPIVPKEKKNIKQKIA